MHISFLNHHLLHKKYDEKELCLNMECNFFEIMDHVLFSNKFTSKSIIHIL